MACTGSKAEAADLARELFPQGPSTLGGLALGQLKTNIARNAVRVALDQGNTDLAEDQLQAALTLTPNDSDSLDNLRLIRLRQRMHDAMPLGASS